MLKPVRVAKGDAFGELRPYARGFRVELEIDFEHPLIGRQSVGARRRSRDVPPRTRARAHLRLHARRREAVERRLRARRLVREHAGRHRGPRAQSGRPALSPTSSSATRRSTRIGDLALAGAPLLGAYRSVRGGHKLNHAVLSALMADPSAWTVVEAGAPVREAPRRVIARPCRRSATGLVAPAYGPDVS